MPVTLKNFQKWGTGVWNVTDVSSKSCKNQTKGDRDLKYGLKNFLDCPLTDLVG